MKIRLLGFILGVLVNTVCVAEPAKISQMLVEKGNERAQIEFFLTRPVSVRAFSLVNPDRLVIDFPETQLGVNLQKRHFSTPLLTSLRTGNPKPGTLRLVFELSQPLRYKVSSTSNKVYLAISGNAPIIPPVQKKPRAKATSTTHVVSSPPVQVRKRGQTFVVVIDPGHGGKDSGAMGNSGTKEKNVVLGISQKLANFINQQPGMRAVLTRDGDYFVPLRGRLKLARKGKADLFIAIHADSYFNDRASGASVYALSHRGATSEAARWLAKRDNYSELGGVDLGELEDKSYMLRSVLIDLAQTATTTDSLRLGNAILDSLDQVTSLHYTKVEQAPFVVLKSPDIPSVLVETGFISHPGEEKKLKDPAYQTKIARALFNGVRLYQKRQAATL